MGSVDQITMVSLNQLVSSDHQYRRFKAFPPTSRSSVAWDESKGDDTSDFDSSSQRSRYWQNRASRDSREHAR